MSPELSSPRPMPWWLIVLILIATGILVGVAIGLLGQAFDFATAWSPAGIGAAVGIVAVLLINRRRQAVEAAKRES